MSAFIVRLRSQYELWGEAKRRWWEGKSWLTKVLLGVVAIPVGETLASLSGAIVEWHVKIQRVFDVYQRAMSFLFDEALHFVFGFSSAQTELWLHANILVAVFVSFHVKLWFQARSYGFDERLWPARIAILLFFFSMVIGNTIDIGGTHLSEANIPTKNFDFFVLNLFMYPVLATHLWVFIDRTSNAIYLRIITIELFSIPIVAFALLLCVAGVDQAL